MTLEEWMAHCWPKHHPLDPAMHLDINKFMEQFRPTPHPTPHPGPLPKGEGEPQPVMWNSPVDVREVAQQPIPAGNDEEIWSVCSE